MVRLGVIPRERPPSTTTTRVMNTKDIWQWLGPLARGWGAEDKLTEQRAVLLWPTVGLGSLARALYVERGVLHLAVGSHVVASELNLLKADLLARLGEIAPECGVTDLRFQVRALKSPPRPVVVRSPVPSDVRRARRELPPRLPSRLRQVAAEAVAWAEARDTAILDSGGWRCAGCGLVLVKEKSTCPACGIERFGMRR